LEERLLEHVGRIDSPFEPAVEPKRNHLPQSRAMRLHLGPCRLVSTGRALEA